MKGFGEMVQNFYYSTFNYLLNGVFNFQLGHNFQHFSSKFFFQFVKISLNGDISVKRYIYCTEGIRKHKKKFKFPKKNHVAKNILFA